MDYALPYWFRKDLGSVRQPRVIWTDTKQIIVTDSSAEDAIFETLDEALNAVEVRNYTVDESIGSGHLVSNDALVIQWHEEQFQRFLQARKSYLESPETLYEAYSFADSHPALWSYDPDRRGEPIETSGWHLTRLIGRLQIEPRKVGGETFFTANLNEGSRVLQHNAHYVESGTYEDLIVSLAALLEEEFYPNGVERRMMLPSTFEREADDLAETVRRKGLDSTY